MSGCTGQCTQEQIACAIRQLEPTEGKEGLLAPAVFSAVVETLVATSVELVLFINRRDPEVLLIERNPTGPFRAKEEAYGWVGRLHVPGTMIVRGRTKETALCQLFTREVGVAFNEINHRPELVDALDIPKGVGPGKNPRGQEVNRIYAIEIPSSERELVVSRGGKFYRLSCLDLTFANDAIIPHHIRILQVFKEWVRTSPSR